MNEIKNFQSHNADVEIRELKKEAKKLSELTKLIQAITDSKEIKTVSELNIWLTDKTGFESPRFASDSLDLLDGYKNVLRLSKDVSLTLKQVTPLYDLKPSVIKEIKEKYTTYYSDEEMKEIKTYRKISEQFNSLSYNFRQGVMINREFNLFHFKIK